MTFPQLSDDAGALFERFGVPSQPAFALVDDSGEVETRLGAIDERSPYALLTELFS